jgi:nucleoid DNA-binding protein
MSKLTAVRDPFTKSQLMSAIAEETGLSKKDVTAVFGALNTAIHRHLKPRSAGTFTLPGLAKITVQKKPATKARKGINPFTGEETVFKAKPARRVIKVRPLKGLKDMAEE